MKNNNRSFAFVEIDIGFSMRSQLRCSEKDKNNIAEISELRGYGKVFRINIKSLAHAWVIQGSNCAPR